MKHRFVIAGGGTGGHVIPALAIAEVLQKRNDTVCLIGTQRGLETRLVPEAGFELVTLRSRPFRGTGLKGFVAATLILVRETLSAFRELRHRKIEIVVSVGGYAAVPVTLAALLQRLPLVLVEPNALPGIANRLVARACSRAFVAFDAAGKRLFGRTEDPRVYRVGVPIREGLVREFRNATPPRLPTPPFRLFVFGGSQGARQINENMIAALPKLSRLPLTIVHQTGEEDHERVTKAYSDAGIASQVIPFERQMASRYLWADLVVCRAGALTIAELSLAKKAALLIPLGHVGGGEQIENAQVLQKAGAASVLPANICTPDSLATELELMLKDPAHLLEMGERAGSLASFDAAHSIVEECVALLEQGNSSEDRNES